MNKNDSEPYKSWVKNGLYSLLYKQLDSTNLAASLLLESGKIAGPTAIITDEQRIGRGQLRTKWHSAPGKNLTFTIAIPKLNVPVNRQFKLNKVVALALQQTILPLAGDVKIKWPNDIYHENKKLCGILIENQIVGAQIKSCIIGVGLNVNQSIWTVETQNPTSLKNITHKSYKLNEFQALFPSTFYEHFLNYLTIESTKIDALFNEALFGLGQNLDFRDSEKTFSARILGVNTLGKLMLEKDSGEQVEYANKEVKFLLGMKEG